ncbi:DUF1659 domain-containing protein [Clostridium sp. MSJ-11]|uniref:DUF1659 domain-containing protein n=1 Tax=Clostridium mobile TaxID=2841512 RepID=A0ABS6EI59_9CLOT|nr:DUF1659 domain-containing protein [Clostridium mobile]MBU5484150.1 DUF1659 domain-containing protein [Clostridium mobile]
MAVVADRYDSDLVLQVVTGVGDDGKDKTKNKTISKISLTATDEDLYAVAVAMADVLKYETVSIRRINKNILLG